MPRHAPWRALFLANLLIVLIVICDIAASILQVTTALDGTTVATQVPGYEPEHRIITNTTGLQIPIAWTTVPPAPAVKVGTQVQLRIYFRDATVYAVGAFE